MPHHHLCLRGLGGSWHGRAPRREVVLAVERVRLRSERAARLSTSSSARLDRWGSGGGRGGGGGGTGGGGVRVDSVRDGVLLVPRGAGHFGCAQRGVPTVQTVQKAVLASTSL